MSSEKSEELTKEIPEARFHVSVYLETNATEEERDKGLDIADYFLKWNWVNEKSDENEELKKHFTAERKKSYEGNEGNEPFEKTFISEQIQKLGIIPFEEYAQGLQFENRVLITSEKYPAIWDIGGGTAYINRETKDFIKMADRNHNLLTLQKRFDL